MRILAINGSPNRFGSTIKLIDMLMEECVKAGAECERVNVEDYDLTYCKGCNSCINGKECVQDDDFIHLKAKMIEADAVVIGSPNYDGTPTDNLVILMSRLSHSKYSASQFKDKFFVGVATSASDNSENIAKYCACLGNPDHEHNYRVSGLLHVTTVNHEGIKDIVSDKNIIEKVKKVGIKLVEDIRRGNSGVLFRVKQFIRRYIKK